MFRVLLQIPAMAKAVVKLILKLNLATFVLAIGTTLDLVALSQLLQQPAHPKWSLPQNSLVLLLGAES